ncbi:amino acid ABC transporter permease [Pseudoruegeria sp. SK021]|uniref:amino acid ABC transporter permease n=1 Tax=Pseudoruegeria sp. SK021 TaxID=1933035 RepID=UPI000A23CF31|nr:amino acid ABC transporter permease [Pseudoruegeria sp. SK021]OSP56059.1 amino acid ABC transporter [Pseudoruegeria sp. SK021]
MPVKKRSGSEAEFPWWLVAAAGLGAYFLYRIVTDDLAAQVLVTVSRGIQVTLMVSVLGFAMAAVLGFLLALALVSRWRVLRQLARFYVEILRGVPVLVLLLYVAFVAAPGLVGAMNWVRGGLGLPEMGVRDFPLVWRAIFALTLGYSAFLAEVFRAGLQAVDAGQIEAAKALGLSGWQRMRLVIFPQAFRTILPPLGNDFVAIVKDSSLVSVLGVGDVTQLGKVTAAANFRYFETYNIVALIYLTLTISLSLILRRLERSLRDRAQ